MSEPESNELKRPPGPPVPDAPGPEDPGTQALSDALRSSFFVIQIIMVLLVVVFFGSGFFTVKEQNKAIILRMGKPVGTGDNVLLLPGPHFAFPRPIDEVTNVPFTSVLHAESSVGWYKTVGERANGAPDPMPTPSLDPSSTVSYMLTADTNIIHLKASVTYRIAQPITFYFEFADAPGFVTNDLDNALLFAASGFTVDDILSRRPTEFREAVAARIRELTDQQGLGITVDRVDLDSAAPLALAADFSKVTQAYAQRDTTLNQARSYENQVLGGARGEKEARMKTAESQTARQVGLLGAEQTNFSRLLTDYERNPQLVMSLLQADVFVKVWTNAQSSMVLPDLSGSSMRWHMGEPLPPISATTNQPSP